MFIKIIIIKWVIALTQLDVIFHKNDAQAENIKHRISLHIQSKRLCASI